MSKDSSYTSLIVQAKGIRKTILSMIVKAHASHIGSAYSIVEILLYLYNEELKINPKNPLDPGRDRFILSKGWGVSALYAILAEKGFFKKELLDSYCLNGSKLVGTATRNGIPGIEATTGSIGHGLPIGVGIALAGKIQQKNYRVFVLVGDGECNEGSTWEAILQAGQYKLDNLVIIVDYNKWQAYGRIKDVLNLEPFAKKWRSFNWSVKVINGHNFNEISQACSSIPFKKNQPNVIIAHTIKGKGISALEDDNEWHYRTPTDEIIKIAEKELNI